MQTDNLSSISSKTKSFFLLNWFKQDGSEIHYLLPVENESVFRNKSENLCIEFCGLMEIAVQDEDFHLSILEEEEKDYYIFGVCHDDYADADPLDEDFDALVTNEEQWEKWKPLFKDFWVKKNIVDPDEDYVKVKVS